MREEDKNELRSIEYWFRCLDLDGDGFLSIYELEIFYKDMEERMKWMNVEPMIFTDLVSELLDIVRPTNPPIISLRDLRRCGKASFFFNSFRGLTCIWFREGRKKFRGGGGGGKFRGKGDHSEIFSAASGGRKSLWSPLMPNFCFFVSGGGGGRPPGRPPPW